MVRGSEDAGLLYPECGWIKTPWILSACRECKEICHIKPWLSGQQIWFPVIYGENISTSASAIFYLWNSVAVEKVKEKYITFGAKEKWDVQRWAIYVSERNKEKLPIYLYGQSMGASAVLMASGYWLPPEVKGLIADCGFQSMERQMRDMADNWFHLHYIPLLLKEMECLCHLIAGFHMQDADTTEAMKRNTRPVLFFHGEKDTYVYPNNSFQNYMLCRAPKELVIVPGAMASVQCLCRSGIVSAYSDGVF